MLGWLADYSLLSGRVTNNLDPELGFSDYDAVLATVTSMARTARSAQSATHDFGECCSFSTRPRPCSGAEDDYVQSHGLLVDVSEAKCSSWLSFNALSLIFHAARLHSERRGTAQRPVLSRFSAQLTVSQHDDRRTVHSTFDWTVHRFSPDRHTMAERRAGQLAD